MVVCKYFLQGTCRFGNSCKFDHQINNGGYIVLCILKFFPYDIGIPDHNYGSSPSILVQNQYNKPSQGASNVDTNTLVKATVNDMTSAEKGGQWLLSSYAPFRDKPAFPGFEDHSMEEIRYLFYESAKNGTADQYKQNLQMMLQQAVMKIKALQNPSPDAVNMLKSIYNTPPSSSFHNNQAPFSAAPSASAFTSQPQKPIFGAPAPNQSVFAGPQQTVFAAPPNASVFAGRPAFANQQNQSKSIFAGPQQTAPAGPIFGATPFLAGAQPQSVFANQNPQFAPQQNVFQNSNGQFAPRQTANPQFPAPTPAGPFSSPLIASGQVGTPPVPNGQFAAPQTSASPFEGPQVVGGPFGVAPTGNKPAFQHTQNIFGNLGMQTGNGNAFTGAPAQSAPNQEFYSKLEELTEEEIKWFQSDDLDINNIPEKPPTYEMCFKVQ
jgi:hypothetical protein